MSLTIDYIISLCHLFGIVHKEKVVEIYNLQNEEQITLAEIEQIMENEQLMLEKHFVHADGHYFIHETIVVFDEFDSYMTQKAGKPHYIPKKKELLKYKDDFYFEKTKEYQELENYIQRELVEGDRERAHEISEEVQGMCHVETHPNSILNNISSYIDFKNKEQLYEMMDLVMNLSNNTRIWANNGYTPNELFETHEKRHLRPLQATSLENSVHKEKKIGRNDLCPCGSGKKYKKCCL